MEEISFFLHLWHELHLLVAAVLHLWQEVDVKDPCDSRATLDRRIQRRKKSVRTRVELCMVFFLPNIPE